METVNGYKFYDMDETANRETEHEGNKIIEAEEEECRGEG